MDAIKEAMIREEDTGERNPALDQYREVIVDVDRLIDALRNIAIGGIGETMWTVDEIRAYACWALSDDDRIA